jgi:superoxide dismutase
MEIHHDKHHGTYVTNVNNALEGNALGDLPIEELLTKLDEVPRTSATPCATTAAATTTTRFSGRA